MYMYVRMYVLYCVGVCKKKKKLEKGKGKKEVLQRRHSIIGLHSIGRLDLYFFLICCSKKE